jgi:hypothetical protein
MKRKLFGGSVEYDVLPCFHFICMVYVTFHLRHVYAPRAIHRWNAAPPGTSRTRIYELSMLALFYVVLLSQIVLLLCVRAAMMIQADEPWLSRSWWSHSMPSFSINPNLGHRLRHEEPPAPGDPCDTRSNTHGGPCRRPARTSHARTRVKTPRWRGGIVRRGGCLPSQPYALQPRTWQVLCRRDDLLWRNNRPAPGTWPSRPGRCTCGRNASRSPRS